MMMNRHRSTSRSRSRARESESRQPEEDGRRSSGRGGGPSSSANVPRSPRSTASSAAAPSTPGAPQAPSTPHSAPPPSSFPKTRCYRLNLEKPFDIRNQKSPLGRDYSGPPIHDSDLPPAQGPVEYYPPPHLCSKEEMAWRRHSWGGAYGGGASAISGGGASTPSELMANLHVSVSEESTNSKSDPTSIAISTARIFRGIVVDRNGVITSMNSRAMRSQRGKGGENKNKMGEKSRQAAKIDKAKDLIDEVVENGGVVPGGTSDEENDPTKIVSLFVMGEYEELNDLVRDGSKKLRDSKSLTDEAILMYNRPRQLPPGMQAPQPMAISPAVSPTNSNANYGSSGAPQSPYAGDPTMSPSSQASNPAASPVSNLRKRVFSADKSRSRYKQVPRSAPPKLKSNPRDTRSSAGSSSGRGGRGTAASPTYHRGNSNMSHQAQQAGGPFGGCVPLGHHSANPTTANDSTSKAQQQQPHHYFQQQCNLWPGNSDWTEALGFSVNSLWNCGANGGHLSPTMSPHSNPSSPRGSQHGGSSHQGGHHAPPATGGGVYHGSGAPTSGYHQSSGGGGYHHQSSSGYHHQPSGYHGNSQSGYHGSSNNYSTPYRDEGRNPSYGYGRGNGGAGVRDTVVM